MNIPKKNFQKNALQNPSSQVRLSFEQALSQARYQIDLTLEGAYRTAIKDQAEELAMIIAEVYLMHPNAHITISGEQLDGHLVQQVFRQLTSSHVELVISNFNRTTYMVKNKKFYLRTALYNSVFELSSHYMNLVTHHMSKGER